MVGADEQIVEIALGHGAVVTAVLKQEVGKSRTHHAVLVPVEVLYRGMKDFIGENPTWDQYRVMSSALAHFLFQNGCDDRAVTERYLDDLFIRPDH